MEETDLVAKGNGLSEKLEVNERLSDGDLRFVVEEKKREKKLR